MFFQKKCFYCRQKILKEKTFKKEVRVYGKVGTFKKDFCNEEHAEAFESFTEELLKRKRVCIPCALRR